MDTCLVPNQLSHSGNSKDVLYRVMLLEHFFFFFFAFKATDAETDRYTFLVGRDDLWKNPKNSLKIFKNSPKAEANLLCANGPKADTGTLIS